MNGLKNALGGEVQHQPSGSGQMQRYTDLED